MKGTEFKALPLSLSLSNRIFQGTLTSDENKRLTIPGLLVNKGKSPNINMDTKCNLTSSPCTGGTGELTTITFQ